MHKYIGFKLDININNISSQISTLEGSFYSKLLDQLNKDLNLCGITWQNYPNVNQEDLFLEIDSIIQELIKSEGDTVLYSLLYRIDISEKIIRQTNFTKTSEITTLVLSREMEKIWLRTQYSK